MNFRRYLSISKEAHALKEATKISKWNGDQSTFLECSTIKLKETRESQINLSKLEESETESVLKLFTNMILFRHLLAILSMFFIFNFLYDLFLFYMPKLPGGSFINLT